MRTRARANGHDPLGRAVADLQHLKATARSNEEALRCDRALCCMVSAANHAKFVGRFLGLADAERQAGATAVSYGNQRIAEEASDRANQYEMIAQNHARAAELYQRRGEELAYS